MIWNTLVATLNLSRFITSTILFLAILLPLWFHLGDWLFAVTYSVPILTASMNGFIINDISDIEADKINHPERPLPQEEISEFAAVIVYYALLAVTLLTIKILIANQYVYGYLVFVIGLINYNYVVRHTPKIKNIYIALVGTTPFIVLWQLLPNFEMKLPVISSLFFFVLGRELLMDVHDADGDKDSLAKYIGNHKALKLAFASQIIGIILLLFSAAHIYHFITISVMGISQLLIMYYWHRVDNQTSLIKATRLMFLGGIVLLL